MALSKTTQDHDEIQQWAERRGAVPAEVASTHSKNEPGILRFCFPKNTPQRNDANLREVSWDEFFQKFDENGLELVFQEVTSEGAESNFNKLIYPTDENHSSRHGKSSTTHAAASHPGSATSSKSHSTSSGTHSKSSDAQSKSAASSSKSSGSGSKPAGSQDSKSHAASGAHSSSSHDTKPSGSKSSGSKSSGSKPSSSRSSKGSHKAA